MTGTLHKDFQYTFSTIFLSVLLKWEIFQTKVVEKIKTPNLMFSNFFLLPKSSHLWDNVGKYCRTGQATDDKMVHTHCMLDTQGCKHTLRICNTYCISTAKIITQTRLCVRLCIHCLSCLTVSFLLFSTCWFPCDRLHIFILSYCWNCHRQNWNKMDDICGWCIGFRRHASLLVFQFSKYINISCVLHKYWNKSMVISAL